MSKAVAYVRVSTEDQVEKWSISAQLKLIEKFARGRGIKLVRVFKDEGVSGSIPPEERPGFRKLLDFIEQNKGVKYLIIVKYDRLSRGGNVLVPLIASLIKKGIRIFSVDELTLSIESIDDLLKKQSILQFYDIIAQLEKTRTLERMMTVFLGGTLVFMPPYGYKIKKEVGIVIDEEEAKFVKFIYKAYLLRGMNLNKLSKITGLSPSRIKYMLTNEAYRGIFKVTFRYRFGGESIEKQVELRREELAIIDEKTWRKVQKKLKRKKRGSLSIIKLREETEKLAEEMLETREINKYYKETMRKRREEARKKEKS